MLKTNLFTKKIYHTVPSSQKYNLFVCWIQIVFMVTLTISIFLDLRSFCKTQFIYVTNYLCENYHFIYIVYKNIEFNIISSRSRTKTGRYR